MNCLFKILCIFEVRNTLISNDANTETKTKRERTDASAAVILMHRMGVLRSDSLPLFNQKSFIMRNTNDVCSCTKCTAIDLVNRLIINNDWSDHVPEIKNTLQELLLAYIRGEQIGGDSIEAREKVAFHMYTLNYVLDTLLEFEKNNLKTEAA